MGAGTLPPTWGDKVGSWHGPRGGPDRANTEQLCLTTSEEGLPREPSGDKQEGEPLRHTQFQNRDAQNIPANRDKRIGTVLLSEPGKNERQEKWGAVAQST